MECVKRLPFINYSCITNTVRVIIRQELKQIVCLLFSFFFFIFLYNVTFLYYTYKAKIKKDIFFSFELKVQLFLLLHLIACNALLACLLAISIQIHITSIAFMQFPLDFLFAANNEWRRYCSLCRLFHFYFILYNNFFADSL